MTMSRGRLFLFLGIALMLLALAAAWQRYAAAHDGAAAYERGVAALDKGDARTARVELLNAVRAEPRSASVRLAQARALIELGDGAGAQEAVERARTLGAPLPATRALMAQALLLRGENGAALIEGGASDMAPEDAAMAARMVGRAHMAQGDAQAARAAFERAVGLSPKDAELWVDIGRYRLALGDEAGAIASADRAVALAPGSVKTLTFRGEMTRSQYGLAAALPWFEKALKASPDTVPTLTAYAATLADMGEASRMLSVTRRILALEPDNARAWMMQAIMAARAGKDDLARTLLGRTHGALDGEPATMLLRGVLHLRDGNALLAIDSLTPLLGVQPENQRARLLLARAQMGAGDLASAATLLAPLVVQGDADPYVLTLAARVQEGLGDRVMAADMLARAAWPVRPAAVAFAYPGDAGLLGAGPPANSGTAGDNIPYIRALMNAGQLVQAVDRAHLLSRMNPGAPDAHMLYGDALGRAGRNAEAAKAYEAAARIRFSQTIVLRLAAAWQRAGDPMRAAQIVARYLAQNPTSLEAQRLAASAYLEAGDWRNARRLLDAVRTQSGDNDALLMVGLARTAMELGDMAKARAFAAHAYRLLPGNPLTADIYGRVLTRSEDKSAAAVDLLEKAVAMAPGDPAIRAHLVEAYAAAGRSH
ncbi:tetratricopeptide repeat protein [Sphingobium aromaticiconvertens]|uniref:tetratricopeptide repeat protein n=1 Tax=Sphingobium aromaticiconvertens TaxID=365341 RepID=UPI00301623C1